MYTVRLTRFRLTIVATWNYFVRQFLSVSVALLIQQAMRMRHNVLSFEACPAVPCFFPYYLTNDTIFGKTLHNTMCVLIFSTICV
jgi:hypothetical protein